MNKNTAMQIQFLQEDAERQQRWNYLTEDIEVKGNPEESKYRRLVLEALLEQEKQFCEANTTGSFPAFTTYAFPLIRRIFPNLYANELVSIQPMSMPTGMVFYYDVKYGSARKPTAAGDRMDYQGGKFNKFYASGWVKGEGLTGTVDGSNKVFQIPTAYLPVLTGTLTVYVDSAAVAVADVDVNTGEVELVEAPALTKVVTGDFRLAYEGTDNAPEIEFEITSDTVTAEQSRLKAKWTLESQQDLFAYYGLDAEQELTATMADEIKREIDQTIIADLYNAASTNVNWSKALPASGWSGTTKDWNETLAWAILDADTAIYKKRLVNANWLVTTPDVCARLEKIDGFRYEGGNDGGAIQKGMKYQGTLKNKYRVYSDPLFPADKILLGYKGGSMFDTGYVYSPYVPLYLTPVIMDTDFKPRRACMTRYARKLVSNDFYATVSITA